MKYFAQLTNEEQLVVLDRFMTLVKKYPTNYPNIHEAVDGLINSKVDDLEDTVEIRFCDECGKLMVEGYLVAGGEEYYCSDECLHRNYTHDEWLAIYAGLDNTDPEEVWKASHMSQEELDRLNYSNDSQSCYTAWEV